MSPYSHLEFFLVWIRSVSNCQLEYYRLGDIRFPAGYRESSEISFQPRYRRADLSLERVVDCIGFLLNVYIYLILPTQFRTALNLFFIDLAYYLTNDFNIFILPF